MTATHDWNDVASALSLALKPLRSGAPETMAAFSGLAKAALEPKALDTKTKELIALGISVATRCDGCIAFHAQAAVKQGATRREAQTIFYRLDDQAATQVLHTLCGIYRPGAARPG